MHGPVSNDRLHEVTVGNLLVNFKHQSALLDNEKVILQPKEYQLLAFFAANVGKVFSRQRLHDHLYQGLLERPHLRAVNTYVCLLRTKIGKTYIETVEGEGYRLCDATLH